MLAQRSASAAKEIKQLIGELVAKVDLGGKLVEQAVPSRVVSTFKLEVRATKPASVPTSAAKLLPHAATFKT